MLQIDPFSEAVGDGSPAASFPESGPSDVDEARSVHAYKSKECGGAIRLRQRHAYLVDSVVAEDSARRASAIDICPIRPFPEQR